MSIADSFTFVVVNENSGSSDNNLAPLYVMKGALRELNDRYTKLQTRISYLEDENLRLKNSLKKEAVLSEDNGKNGFDLTGKIGGSYARGENLWAKGFLSSKDKSQALSNFTTSRDSFDYPMSKQMSSSVLKSEDIKVKEESLEEIPLRGGYYGRTGHDSKDGDAEEKIECDEDNLESIDIALKDIVKNMKRDQEILKQQQEGLKSALEIFKKIVKENTMCKSCMKKDESTKSKENKVVSTEELIGGRREEGYHKRERIRIPIPSSEEANPPPLKDRICPLCEKYFHCSTPFDTFNEHVLSHFVEEEDGDEKVSSYQVIT